MPDIGMMEMLVIAVVALIVVGPKDLPKMFRRAGQVMGRIRGMAREFQRAMDDAADEAGMTELNRDLRSAAKFTRNPAKAGTDALKGAFNDIDPEKYPEGSHTRDMAERRKAKAEDTKAKIAEVKAAKAAGSAPATTTAGDDAAPAGSVPDGSHPAPEPAVAPPVEDKPRTGTDAT